MERKIGSTFKSNTGITLKVIKDETQSCIDCFFSENYGRECATNRFLSKSGPCTFFDRSDKEDVIFVRARKVK